MKSWITASVLAWTFMGICNVFAKVASERIPFTSVAIWWATGYIPLTLALIAVLGFPREFHRRSLLYSFAAGVIGQAAALAFYLALSSGMLTLVTAIAYLYPLITMLIAYAFLKERFRRRHIAGVFLACVAIVCFSF